MPRIHPLFILLVVLAGGTLAAEAQEEKEGVPTYRLETRGWEASASPEPGTPEAALLEARRALAEEAYEEAEKAADAWIKANAEHALLPAAHIVRGDAKMGQRRYFDALFDYEAVIRSFPASAQFHEALDRELNIAELFASGVKRRFLGMRILPAFGEAEEIFIRTQERAPGSALGERASLALGDHYYRRGEMGHAAEAYDLFTQNYPRSEHRQHAMRRLIQANLARFKGPKFDATGLLEARERLRMFQDDYPAAAERIGAEALLIRIEESLAQKKLEQGRWYEKRNEPVSAAYLYRRIIEAHSTTASAETALERLEALGRPYERQPAPGPGEEPDT